MATIQRLTDSCLLVTTESEAVLFDPGFHTYQSGEFDLDSLGDVSRVMITHQHGDHVNPDFVAWVLDRGEDVTVHTNQTVVDILAKSDIEAITDLPEGVSAEDVQHEVLPTGDAPPNRAFTLEGLLTHPGDSHQPTRSAPVLALPLMAPWGSATAAVGFARRLGPRQVVAIHDFYMSRDGRAWIRGIVKEVLAADGIELVDLDWGDSYTL
jgi:L-ascorbate metabolism protein UlaG (beta-lactamase superfamily)